VVTIVSIQKVRAAIARAEELGAESIEEACQAAAHALAIDVEAVRGVAYEVSTSEGGQ
jgi:hypothetical protein